MPSWLLFALMILGLVPVAIGALLVLAAMNDPQGNGPIQIWAFRGIIAGLIGAVVSLACLITLIVRAINFVSTGLA